MSRDNTCIFCNESIPEGRMVCPVCEEALRNVPAGKYTKKSFIATLKKEAKKLFRIA
ncbi:hypothetical protein [Mediterraneibacter gnavus]|jgi:hypothetical protein|uniref:hypothetical protein n=1 Tax=Mediterraneibacter gnavus TaxID=33038 RepID=UPI003672221D